MLCSQWLVTGVTCNNVRGAARRHALNESQIKRRVNQLSMMLKLGRITRFDTNNHLLHTLADAQVFTKLETSSGFFGKCGCVKAAVHSQHFLNPVW